MKKQVKSLKEISSLGKSLNDLANEIVEGRGDAVAGILKMDHAYIHKGKYQAEVSSICGKQAIQVRRRNEGEYHGDSEDFWC